MSSAASVARLNDSGATSLNVSSVVWTLVIDSSAMPVAACSSLENPSSSLVVTPI